MTSATTPDDAAYLAALPPTVQRQLVQLVRTAADTSDEEKVTIMTFVNTAMETVLFGALSGAANATQLKVVPFLQPVGELLAAIYRTGQEGKVA